MIINTPISLGELIDKISILEIKKQKIKSKTKLKFISYELVLLKEILKKNKVENKKIKKLKIEIKKINQKLWKIEDDIRKYENKKIFNKNFINLARSVYKFNDKRAKIKLDINKFRSLKNFDLSSQIIILPHLYVFPFSCILHQEISKSYL